MKKKELIERKLDEFHQYAVSQKFPLVDRYDDLRKKFTITQIVALVERFLVPAHNSGLLREYTFAELERYKLLCLASGELDAAVLDFEFSDGQKNTIVEMMEYVIKILLL